MHIYEMGPYMLYLCNLQFNGNLYGALYHFCANTRQSGPSYMTVRGRVNCLSYHNGRMHNGSENEMNRALGHLCAHIG